MTGTPATITDAQANAMLEHITHLDDHYWGLCLSTRNRLCFLLMLDAGLRLSETVQLAVNDLWIQGCPVTELHIRPETSKSNTGRFIPTSERLKSAISDMRERVWQPHVIVRWALPARFFTMSNHISGRQVERIIGSASLKAIGRHIHPHVLRHTFGTNVLRSSNLRIAQMLLGHKSLSSTQIYTHPNSNETSQAILDMSLLNGKTHSPTQ